MRACRHVGLIVSFVVSAFLTPGCGKEEAAAKPQEKAWTSLIDEVRTFEDLKTFAELGGMNHAEGNSEVIRKGRELMKEKLRLVGLTKFDHDGFLQKAPRGEGLAAREVWMENVVGILPGKRPEAIAFACHYDNKILAGQKFVGANDGASGVALNIELARQMVLKHQGDPPEFTLYFVFFDGEEAFIDWHQSYDGIPDNCYGSRRMAANRARFPIDTLILLDMVGDKDLELCFEVNSHPELRNLFVEAGKGFFGIDIFGKQVTILDDHLPFKEAGMLRVIDLIDLNYGPNNSHWHTENDVVENCSARSLAKVGSLVLTAYPAVVAWLKTKIP